MGQQAISLRTCLAVIVVFLGLLVPGVSQASLTGVCGPLTSEPAQVGFCQKMLTISGSVLTITLNNTSPDGNGGFIVADAFNLPQGVSVTGYSSPDNENFDTHLDGIVNTAPFGTRTDVISLGGDLNNAWTGADGNPAQGIGVGQSATFTFLLSGTGVNETDVFNSELVRFKGFTNGSSDKTGVHIGSDGPPTAVPEPATLLLVGPGMAGIVWLRHRRRRRRVTSPGAALSGSLPA